MHLIRNRHCTVVLWAVAVVVGAGCASTHIPEAPGLEWVAVEGGQFTMGDVWTGMDPDATPVHLVQIDDLWVSRYETTWDQYDWYTSVTGVPRHMPKMEDRGMRAVHSVTWAEAVAFCAYVGGRLPTEPEWEFLAAGGVRKERYPGTNIPDDAGDYVRSHDSSIAESFFVGSKKPNAFGLYDMGGNVAEWIADYYPKYPQPGIEPEWFDLENFDMRILRGGSYAQNTPAARTAKRAGTLQDVRSEMNGFRCVRDR